MNKFYESCEICPRKCNINRNKYSGFCGGSSKVKVARSDLYFYEEPSISGVNGSGAIFFSGCSLKCCYCQNKEISLNNFGKEVSIERLSDMMIELQERGAHNINLVTPTHFIPSIAKSIKLARKKGLNIPIVYNTNGYENLYMLKLLDGLVDIYLTDFKYCDNKLGYNLSKVDNYFEVAKDALLEMYKQVNKNEFNKDGLMTKGVIVRCLVLPTKGYDTKRIIKYLYDTYKDNIYLSIMNQYTPITHNKDYPFLNKSVSLDEYDDVINYAVILGVNNAYIQEGGTVSESFIPEFDLKGV